MFYVSRKEELIDPSQQKFPKRWPDNRAPVIIRIDGTNLLLMIRKMRSSRPHFKYIFHYRGADKQRHRFLRQSPFAVCLSPTEIQFSLLLPRHNVSLWWCLDCPKLKAFVSKQRGEFQALSQCRDIEVFYFVSYSKSQQIFSFPGISAGGAPLHSTGIPVTLMLSGHTLQIQTLRCLVCMVRHLHNSQYAHLSPGKRIVTPAGDINKV